MNSQHVNSQQLNMSDEEQSNTTGLTSHLVALKAALSAFATQKGKNSELWNHALAKGLLAEAGLVTHLQNYDPVEMKDLTDTATSDVILIFKYIRSMLNDLLDAMTHAPTWTGQDETGEQRQEDRGEQNQEDMSKYAVLVVANAIALSGACALVDPTPPEPERKSSGLVPVIFYESPATLRRLKTGEKTANKYTGSGKRPGEKPIYQQVPSVREKMTKKKGKNKEKLNNEGKVETSKEKRGPRWLKFFELYEDFVRVFLRLLRKMNFKRLKLFVGLFSPRSYKAPGSYGDVISLAHELFVQLEMLMGVNFKDFSRCSKNTLDMKENNIVYNPIFINWAFDIGMIEGEYVPDLELGWKAMLESIYGS